MGDADIAALDRVLHRLVMTPDDKLAAVLGNLLPILIPKLDDAKLRTKTVEMLNHISKRVRPNTTITLPCEGLLALCSPTASTFVSSFSMVYLEMGLARATEEEKSKVAVGLMKGVSHHKRYSAPHTLRLHLLATIVDTVPLHYKDSNTGAPQVLAFDDAADVLDWFADIMLYKMPGAGGGLSKVAVERLEQRGGNTLTGQQLLARKLSIVRALRSDLFPPALTVDVALIAACDSNHEPSSRAEDHLKAISSADKTGALFRDASLPVRLLELVKGGSSSTPGNSNINDSIRTPAPPAVAVRALTWAMAECTAGLAEAPTDDAVAVALQCLHCGSGINVTQQRDRAGEAKLRAVGGRLLAFIAAREPVASLMQVAPVVLSTLRTVLMTDALPPPSVTEDGAQVAAAATSLSLDQQRTATLEACYEALSSFAHRLPSAVVRDPALPQQLFMDISRRESELRVKVAAALGALRNAYKIVAGSDAGGDTSIAVGELWELLWVAARSPEHRSRLCAVEWACELFPFSSAQARHLCAALSHDGITAVRSAAMKGLVPPSSSPAEANSPVVDVPAYPAFAEFVGSALVESTGGGRGGPIAVQELSPGALARTLDFAMACLSHSGSGYTSSVFFSALTAFMSRLEAALSVAPGTTGEQSQYSGTGGDIALLHSSAARSLKGLLEMEAQSKIQTSWRQQCADRGPWLLSWLSHESSLDVREAVGEVAGLVAPFMSPETQLSPFLRGLTMKLKAAAGVLSPTGRVSAAAHGALHAVGAIFERIQRGEGEGGVWASLSQDALPQALSAAVQLVGHPTTLLHSAACTALGRAGGNTRLPLPSSESTDVAKATATGIVPLSVAFDKLWAVLSVRGEANNSNSANAGGAAQDEARRAEFAAEAVGKVCRGLFQGPSPVSAIEASSIRRSTLDALFSAATAAKSEELQLAAGTAVADIARSGPLLLPADEWSAVENRARAAGARIPVHSEASEDGGIVVDALEYVLHTVLLVQLEDRKPQGVVAAAVTLLCVVKECKHVPGLLPHLPAMQAAFTRRLTARGEFAQEVAGRGLALVYSAAGEGQTRAALVESLIDSLGTGRRRPVEGVGIGVDIHGPTPAGAALSEAGDGAYAEMCGVANDVGRPDLIYSFLSLASSHSAWATRRGASFSLGAIMADGVAAEALRPHLGKLIPRLYRYRFDSSSKTRSSMEQLWKAVVGSDEQGAIRQHFPSILSDLCTSVRSRKWRDRQSACLALASLLAGRTWSEIGAELSSLWDAAAAAIDDVKETVSEAGGDFAKTLANVSVRLCDCHANTATDGGTGGSGGAAAETDAQDGVDSAGGAAAFLQDAARLITAVGTEHASSMNIEGAEPPSNEQVEQTSAALLAELSRLPASEALRLAASGGGRDRRTAQKPPTAKALAEAELAAGVVLPWLLDKGIMSRCAPVQALSLKTLQRCVEACEASTLRPHLASLIATLIEGMSALEPAALQYIQFHAEKQYGVTPEQMERLRLSASRAGPLQGALDRCCKYIDDDVATSLMPRLQGLLRGGVGLATRSAAACLVVTLCVQTPRAVRAAARRLLPTLTNASLSERSQTVRATYVSALAAVARQAPHTLVAPLANRLTVLFRAADPQLEQQQRRASAVILKELATRAATPMGGAGSKVEWHMTGWAVLLPLAFVARFDPDTPVADAFTAAWNEGLSQLQSGGGGSAVGQIREGRDAALLMLEPIVNELLAGLGGVTRVARVQAGGGSSALATVVGTSLSTRAEGIALLRGLLRALQGGAWEGKEKLISALVNVSVSCKGGAVVVPLCLGAQDNVDVNLQGALEGAEFEVEDSMEIQESDDNKDSASSVNGAANQDTTDDAMNIEESNNIPVSTEKGEEKEDTSMYKDRMGELLEDMEQYTPSTHTPTSVEKVNDSPIQYAEILRLLLLHLQRKDVGLRRAAASSLTILLKAYTECNAYEMVAPVLLKLARLDGGTAPQTDPILEARAAECLAAAWPKADTFTASRRELAPKTLPTLSAALRSRPWSVKVPLLKFMSVVLGGGGLDSVSSSVLSKAIECAVECVKDPKYAAVREAAATVVLCLAEEKSTSGRLALTSHKEMLEEAARVGIKDTTAPPVVEMCSRALQQLAWWP